MDNYTSRKHVICDIGVASNILVKKNLAQLLLRFSSKSTIDFGALCYLKRDSSRRSPANRCRKVDASSLDCDRLKAIFKVYEVLVQRKKSRGSRDATLYAAGVQFERFVNWCDRNGHSNLFRNQECATEAYANYMSRPAWL